MVILVLYYKGILYTNNRFGNTFKGQGTAESPYQISSLEDLTAFRDMVNSGETFENYYFRQTSDIDIGSLEWMPIGISGSGNYFMGIYDGDCHTINNIKITESYPYSPANVGLFGTLSGTVKNLGLKGGSISGYCAGGIAGQCDGDTAFILNCYNTAGIKGEKRAGGICDNFGKGSVVNCANFGTLDAQVTGEIISFNAALVAGGYPYDNFAPDSFSGQYINLQFSGNTPEEILNSGLNQLIDSNIINREDATMWQ